MELLHFLGRQSLAVLPFVAGILLLRVVALHRLPKTAFTTLWGAAWLRLMLPFALPCPFALGALVEPLIPATLVAAIPSYIPAGSDAGMETAAAPQTSLRFWLGLAGALAVAGYFAVGHLRARRLYVTALPITTPFAVRWRQTHPLKRPLRLLQSDQITATLTFGVLRPVILLPKAIQNGDETALRCLLEHEYAHVCRFDVAKKWLLALALCLHWFNPGVWLLYLYANRDMELACDAMALRRCPAIRRDYALLLVRLAEQRSVLPLAGHFSALPLQERIITIMKNKKTSLLGGFAAGILVTALVLVLATIPAQNGILGATVRTFDAAAPGQAVETGDAAEVAANVREIAKTYAAYGLSYDAAAQWLSYNGQPVRCFADNRSDDPLTFSGTMLTTGDKNPTAADVVSVRDTDGKLIGLETRDAEHRYAFIEAVMG